MYHLSQSRWHNITNLCKQTARFPIIVADYLGCYQERKNSVDGVNFDHLSPNTYRDEKK